MARRTGPALLSALALVAALAALAPSADAGGFIARAKARKAARASLNRTLPPTVKPVTRRELRAHLAGKPLPARAQPRNVARAHEQQLDLEVNRMTAAIRKATAAAVAPVPLATAASAYAAARRQAQAVAKQLRTTIAYHQRNRLPIDVDAIRQVATRTFTELSRAESYVGGSRVGSVRATMKEIADDPGAIPDAILRIASPRRGEPTIVRSKDTLSLVRDRRRLIAAESLTTLLRLGHVDSRTRAQDLQALLAGTGIRSLIVDVPASRFDRATLAPHHVMGPQQTVTHELRLAQQLGYSWIVRSEPPAGTKPGKVIVSRDPI